MIRRETFRSKLPERRSFALAALLGALAGVASPIGHDPTLPPAAATPDRSAQPPTQPENSTELTIERPGEEEQAVLDFVAKMIQEKELPMMVRGVVVVQPTDPAFIEYINFISERPGDFPGNAALYPAQVHSLLKVELVETGGAKKTHTIVVALDRKHHVIGLGD